MNIKVMLFSGIMTALVGLMLGIVITEISQREHRRNVHIVGGGTLGFVLGFAFQGIKQQKDEQPDYDEQTKSDRK